MRNSENIKVLISEAMRWDIDERELYSRRKLERQREEIQEKEFQKEQKNGEKKNKCSCKNKAMTLLNIA